MLYWLDIETTGLDPRVDSILEIGMIVTDDDLEYVHDVPPISDILIRSNPYALRVMPPAVIEMHTKSGLLADLQNRTCLSLAEAEAKLIRYVDSFPSSGPRVLAGSSVHFDRGFISQMFPQLSDRFSHRHADVSAMREFVRRWDPTYENPSAVGAHRPTLDILDSIKLARHLRTYMKENK